MTPSCYIVGAADAVARLGELARRLGLGPVESFADPRTTERNLSDNLLAYFFFAPVRDPAGLRPVVGSIRAAEKTGMRFAPLIYFAGTASVEGIRTCAGIGFDDVITHPFTPERVAERLGRQVGRPLVYYETATYFGPDRRGRLAADVPDGRRGLGGEYRRLEIMRSPRSGIQILRDEMHVTL